ncbi:MULTISPECIES: large conductance mechanosensitive channel protein MscL [unclassified Virgibacillus]|uniref:large conductance mechanosensitive channel protein MscL n=1 Tax=unclassified Virgibacillus TaxID=2620237 RepID=UPI0024DE68CE|nr:large conductance mechanosensitive channel protein MscL [Virgibacillus sp. LDC-1]
MWKDFKEFAFKGNVLDLAVAVVIGTAFGKIVSSLVDNIIMPVVSILLQGIKFSNLSKQVKGIEIQYGEFIQSIVDFFIIAFSIFLFVRLLMKFKRKKEEEKVVEEVKVDPKEALLTEIRDLLKEQQNGVQVNINKNREDR